MKKPALVLYCLSYLTLPAQDLKEVLLDISRKVNQKVVSGATKTIESKDTVPAIARVFTAKDLEDFDDLYDALETVPGVVIDHGSFSRRYIQIRNIRNSVYNNKVLFVVNGLKIYEPGSSNFKLDSIPLESVKRLEVIKGPRSVFYGSSAYSGVISIETFDGSGYEQDGARVDLGSHGHRRLSLNKFIKDSRGSHFFSISSRGSNGKELSNQTNNDFFRNIPNGYALPSFERIAPSDGSDFRQDEDIFSFFGHSIIDDIKLNYGFSRVSYDASFEDAGNLPFWGGIFGVPVSHFDAGRVREFSTLEQRFLGLEWNHDLSPRTSLKTVLKYIHMDDQLDTFDKGLFNPHSRGSTKGFDIQLIHKPREDVEFLFGFEQDYLDYEQFFTDGGNLVAASAILNQALGFPLATGVSASVPPGSLRYGGLYIQGTWKLKGGHELLLAGRQNNHTTLGDLFVPKLGYSHLLSPKARLKLIYGKAFRYPAPFELSFNAPMLNFVGNPNLRPEEIESSEVELHYEFQDSKNSSLRLLLFDNDLTNFINVTTTSYVNLEVSESRGMEIELSQQIGSKDEYSLSYSRMLYERHPGDGYIESIVPHMWQFLWKHRFDERWSTNHYFRFLGKRPNKSIFTPTYKGASHFHDLVIRYKHSKNRSFRLKIHNLFDEQVYADTLTQSSPRIAPATGRRKATLAYQIKF